MDNSGKAVEKTAGNDEQQNLSNSEGLNIVHITVEGQSQGRTKECRYIMAPNSSFGQLGELSDVHRIAARSNQNAEPERNGEAKGKSGHPGNNGPRDENTENDEEDAVSFPLERKRGGVFHL